jgi:hypothetical protein
MTSPLACRRFATDRFSRSVRGSKSHVSSPTCRHDRGPRAGMSNNLSEDTSATIASSFLGISSTGAAQGILQQLRAVRGASRDFAPSSTSADRSRFLLARFVISRSQHPSSATCLVFRACIGKRKAVTETHDRLGF